MPDLWQQFLNNCEYCGHACDGTIWQPNHPQAMAKLLIIPTLASYLWSFWRIASVDDSVNEPIICGWLCLFHMDMQIHSPIEVKYWLHFSDTMTQFQLFPIEQFQLIHQKTIHRVDRDCENESDPKRHRKPKNKWMRNGLTKISFSYGKSNCLAKGKLTKCSISIRVVNKNSFHSTLFFRSNFK